MKIANISDLAVHLYLKTKYKYRRVGIEIREFILYGLGLISRIMFGMVTINLGKSLNL